MLRAYLKIWDWDLIFGREVKAISLLGVRSPCSTLKHVSLTFNIGHMTVVVFVYSALFENKRFLVKKIEILYSKDISRLEYFAKTFSLVNVRHLIKLAIQVA